MSTYTAAAQLVRAVINFAQRQPTWAECVTYQTRPDERWDLTLVSQRIYGTRDEYLTIMAAAGLDSPEQELTERLLVLPTIRQLAALKTAAIYVTDATARSTEEAADPVGTR